MRGHGEARLLNATVADPKPAPHAPTDSKLQAIFAPAEMRDENEQSSFLLVLLRALGAIHT